MTRTQPSEHLSSLFDDGGRSVLRSAGHTSWGAALAELEVDPGESAVGQLTALRDLWLAVGAEEAARLATRGVVTAHRHASGDESGRTLREVARLGQLLWSTEPDQAAVLIERAWELLSESAEPGDVDRAWVAGAIGALRVAQERPSEAIFPLREAIRVLSSSDPARASDGSFQLGMAMVEIGSVEEGMRLIEASVREARQRGAPELPERLAIFARLVGQRLAPKDAEGVHRESVEAARLVHGEMSAQVATAQAALAGVLLQLPGRTDEALGLMDVSVSLLLGSAGPGDPMTRLVAAQLVERLIDLAKASTKDKGLARECLSRAESVSMEVFGPGDGRLVRVRELASKVSN